MKFSKSWLQDYIVQTLPSDKEIEVALNKKAFEVEEIIRLEDDTVFDIKILPNRAHDALGHHGMAYELCASLGLTFNKEKDVLPNDTFVSKDVSFVPVEVNDEKMCTRFMSLRIDGVRVEESPVWLKKRLESIGQRSINNIVDITNYVQFALNKPMHAYDAREIEGTLRTRFAKEGEELVTLDDKTLTLDASTLVIADDEKVLGLAGIKGGKWSGIKSDTTSVILESANFNSSLIRKTSEKYGIRTDASKRFENGIANCLVIEGLHMTANLIHDLYPSAKKGEVTDAYPLKDVFYYVGISKNEVNAILGTAYTDESIQETLSRLSFSYEIFSPKKYIEETYASLVGAGYKNPSSMRYDAPSAFSCSSLISYLYKGVWMPSLSIDKYVFSKKIIREDLSFGDLIFANTGEGVIRYKSVEFLQGTEVKEGVDHVGMYLGDGKVLHATKVRGTVVIETLDEFSVGRTVTGYGRVMDNLDEERYVVKVPATRLDIRIKEDLAEEIGRISGYDMITPVLPSLARDGVLHKRAYYEEKIKKVLLTKGFSEVVTYTFGNEGEVSLVKGLADDKEKLRANLSKGVMTSLTLNLYNAPLLGKKTIQIFELGNVFSASSESRRLAIMADDGAKKSSFAESIQGALTEIAQALSVASVPCTVFSTKPYGVEVDIDQLLKDLPEPSHYEEPFLKNLPDVTYKTVSAYPFITRDIAMWVPTSITWESISTLCSQVGNSLVTRVSLFDTFTKEIEGVSKTSYAFRLVFQSHEKTLTDEEVNSMMEPYYSLLKEQGYEIR